MSLADTSAKTEVAVEAFLRTVALLTVVVWSRSRAPIEWIQSLLFFLLPVGLLAKAGPKNRQEP